MMQYENHVITCNCDYNTIKSDLLELSRFSDVAKEMANDTNENHVLVFFEPEIWEDNTFHPKKCGCLEVNDDYKFGIRCNHLVWIEGYTENDDLGTIYLMGNHKGTLTLYGISLYDTVNNEEIGGEYV